MGVYRCNPTPTNMVLQNYPTCKDPARFQDTGSAHAATSNQCAAGVDRDLDLPAACAVVSGQSGVSRPS